MTLVGTGLSIHTATKIVIPAEIGRIMLGIIPHLPAPGLEYGLYLQGEWDPASATVRVKPDQYFFPQQETSSVSIRFLEEPPGPEWNVVIHRHPAGCRTFSATDNSSINEEFLASVLFIPPWEFPDAVINIPIGPGAKFQTKAKVEVDGAIAEIPDWLQERVGGALQELRVVKGFGVQRAGRGTIQALDGEEVDIGPGTGVVTQRLRGKIARVPPATWPSVAPSIDRGIAAQERLDGFAEDDLADIGRALQASAPSRK